MKKKIFLFSLVLSALLCVFAISAFAGDIITVDNIKYEIKSDSTVYFNADDPTDDTTLGALIIPETITYNGTDYTVTGVRRGGSWPDNNEYINSVIKVELPATVTSVPNHIFRNYKGLTYVKFLGEVSTFNNAEFHQCTALEEVVFAYPDSVKDIKQHVFYGCTSLTKITPMNNLVTIGYRSFHSCPVSYISDFSDVTSIEEDAFRNGNISGDIYIPNLTKIGSHAFRECHNLTGVKLGGTFTGLYNACFYNCYSLEYVILPSSVTTLDQHVFANCSALEYIVISEGLTSASTSNLFQNCNNLKSILYTGNDVKKLTALSVFSSYATAPFADYDQATPPASRTIFYGTPVCSSCGDIDTSEVEFTFTDFTSKMFDQKTCASCGKTDVKKEYAPIITIKGYTKEEGAESSSFAYGFTIDKASLLVYETNTGLTVSYGIIVGSVPENATGDIIDKNGNSLLSSTVTAEFSTTKLDSFSIYNIKLTGIKTDAQKALSIYCNAYAIAGEKISYLGEIETKKAVAVSYNNLPVKG